MPSEECSQELLQLDKRLELWDPTMPQEARMTSMLRTSKELSS